MESELQAPVDDVALQRLNIRERKEMTQIMLATPPRDELLLRCDVSSRLQLPPISDKIPRLNIPTELRQQLP
jgi:hypothetical protein